MTMTPCNSSNMKLHSTVLALLAAFLTLTFAAPASAIVSANSFYTTSLAIPDNDLNGVADTRSLSTPITAIGGIRVTLDIAGNFNNGDLYAYIKHDSDLSVLLNRPGRTAANDDGYFDSGFTKVLFDDVAVNGDIHSYQAVLNPMGAALTGTWQPDARLVDPANSLNTSPRTAFLSAFNGANPNGNWTVFLADAAPGGESTLLGWGLEITAVPEPSALAGSAVVALGVIAMGLFRRRVSVARKTI